MRAGTRAVVAGIVVTVIPAVPSVPAGIADAPVPGIVEAVVVRAVVAVVTVVRIVPAVIPGRPPVPVGVPGAAQAVVAEIGIAGAPAVDPVVHVPGAVELVETGFIGLAVHQFGDDVEVALIVFGEVLIILTLAFPFTLCFLFGDDLGSRLRRRPVINSVVVLGRGIVPRRTTRAGKCRESKDCEESESIVFHFYLL